MCEFLCLNNGAIKRVVNLLESTELIVWKVVIHRITVVKFRMDSAVGSGAGCFEAKIWTDAAKFANVASAEICSENVWCSSKIKPRLQVQWVILREMCILESSCLSLIRSSVVEKLRVRRLAVIQARHLLYSIFEVIMERKFDGW